MLLKDARYEDIFHLWTPFFNALAAADTHKRQSTSLYLKSALLKKMNKCHIFPFLLNTREMVELFSRERNRFEECLSMYLDVVYSVQLQNMMETNRAVLRSKGRPLTGPEGKKEITIEEEQGMELL